MLGAPAAGQSSPADVAALADRHLQATREQLVDALHGRLARHQ